MDVRDFNSELQGLKDWYTKRVVYFSKLSKLLKAVCGKEKLSSLWIATFFEQLQNMDSLEEQKFAWCLFYHVVPNLMFSIDSLKGFKSKTFEAVARLDADLQRALRKVIDHADNNVADTLQKTAFGIQKYIEICVSEADKAFRSGGRRNAPTILELQQFGKRNAAAFQVEVSMLPVLNSAGVAGDQPEGLLVDCKMNTTVQECTMLVAKQLGVTQSSNFTIFVSSVKGATTTTSSAWYPLHPSLFMADVVSEQSRYLGLPTPAPDAPPPSLDIPFLFKAFVLPASNPKGGTSATLAVLVHRQSMADAAAGLALLNSNSKYAYLPFRVDTVTVTNSSTGSTSKAGNAILGVSTQGLLLVSDSAGEMLRCSAQEVSSLDVSRNKVSINTSRGHVSLECHPKHAQGMWTTWQAVLCYTGQIEELRAYVVTPTSASKQRTLQITARDVGPPSPSPPETPPPGLLRTVSSLGTPLSNCSTPVTPLTRTTSCNSTSSVRSTGNVNRRNSGRWDNMSPEVTSAPVDVKPYNPQYRYTTGYLLQFKPSCTAMPPYIDDGPYMKNYVDSPNPSYAPSSPWSPNRSLSSVRRSGSVNSSGRFSPLFPGSPMGGAPGLSPTNSNSSSLTTPGDSGGSGFVVSQDPPPRLAAPPHVSTPTSNLRN